MFDEEGSGKVSLANLRRISEELGRDMSEEAAPPSSSFILSH